MPFAGTPTATRRRMLLACTSLVLAVGMMGCGQQSQTASTTTTAPAASSASDQARLIDEARTTLQSFTADPKNQAIHEMLSRSRAVLVFPNLVKGGFIVGVEGGRGILFARHASSRSWGQPVFMGVADVSLGLQAGVQAAETIMAVYTDRALDKLLTDKVKLGADLSVAVVGAGGGAETATASNFSGDIAVISRAKGLYGGVSVEGGVLAADDDANRAYYGRSVTPREILAMTGSPSTAVQAMHSTLGR